jgi:hypothetical protein
MVPFQLLPTCFMMRLKGDHVPVKKSWKSFKTRVEMIYVKSVTNIPTYETSTG